MAIIDTVTADLVLTQRRELERYTALYDRLAEVALSPSDSLAFLQEVADRLLDQSGSDT